jgi:hypothetical protein
MRFDQNAVILCVCFKRQTHEYLHLCHPPGGARIPSIETSDYYTRRPSGAQAIVDTTKTRVKKLSDVFQEGRSKHGQTGIVLAVSADHVLKLLLKYRRAFVAPIRQRDLVSWRNIEVT